MEEFVGIGCRGRKGNRRLRFDGGGFERWEESKGGEKELRAMKVEKTSSKP